MTSPDPKRVADLFLASQGEAEGADRTASSRMKTAGEVRFVKDRSGDKNEWGWGPPGPHERVITEEFSFKAKELKPLASVLRSTLMALGHATSAHRTFVKIKSARISPDGALGGKGYIMKISDMRRQLMNVIEALSSVSDTIYDEIHAPHWDPAEDAMSPRDREEVKELLEDAKEIREDPEDWAEGEEAEMDAEHDHSEDVHGKKAARHKTAAALDRVHALEIAYFGRGR